MMVKRVLLFSGTVYLLLALAILCGTAQQARAQEVRQEYVDITYYLPTGNPMRSGLYPFVGAAACDTAVFPMGTILELPDGFQVTCLDTGDLRRGQIDIFAPTHAWGRANVLRPYGRYEWTTVIRWGWGG